MGIHLLINLQGKRKRDHKIIVKSYNMKLTVALLVFVVESVPQKRKKANTHPVKTLPSISCEDHGVQITNIDHGKSGQLSVDKYDNNMHCYIDFAKKCVKGVDVKFTH